MKYSKWSISQLGNLSHSGLASLLTTGFTIVILDDHKLFRSAITDYCVRPFFKISNLIEFENGDQANQFIIQELNNKRGIDLLITDINHPGLEGQELSKSIRNFERLTNNSSRIPIIILSMVESTYYPELITENIVDRYITKIAEPEEIIDSIEEILYRDPSS